MEPHRDSLRSPGLVPSQSPAGAPSQGPLPSAGEGRDRQGRRVEIAAQGRLRPAASSPTRGAAPEGDAKSASPLAVTLRRIDKALDGVFSLATGDEGLGDTGSPALSRKLQHAVTDCGGTQLSVAATGHLLRSLLAHEGLPVHDQRHRLVPQDLVPLGDALARGVSGHVMTLVRVDQLARHVRSVAPRLTLEALACLTLGFARAPGKVGGRDDALWAPLARRIAADFQAPQAHTDPRWGGVLELLDQACDDLEGASLSEAHRAHLQARLRHAASLIEAALLPATRTPEPEAKHASPGLAAGVTAPGHRPFAAFLASHRASDDGARTRQASRVLALSLGGREMTAAVRHECLDIWIAAVRALPRQADHRPLVEALCGFIHGALKGPDGSCEALEACVGRMFAGTAPVSPPLRQRWLEDLAMMVVALLKALATPSLDEPALRRFLEALALSGGPAGTPQLPPDDARGWMDDAEAGFLLEQVAGTLCKASPGPFPADVFLSWLGQSQASEARLLALGFSLGVSLGRPGLDAGQRLAVLETVLDAPMASQGLRGAVIDGFVQACLDARADRERIRRELLAIAPGLGLPHLGCLGVALFGSDPAWGDGSSAPALPPSIEGLFSAGAPAFTAQALRVLGGGAGLALDGEPAPADADGAGGPRRRAFFLGWRMAQDPVRALTEAGDGHADVERWLSWFDDASHVPGFLSPARALAVLEQLVALPLAAPQHLALVGGFIQRSLPLLPLTALRAARLQMIGDLESIAATGESPQRLALDGKREAGPADAVASLDAHAFGHYVNGLSHLTAMYQALTASPEAADFLRSELAQVEEAAGLEKMLADHLRVALQQALESLEQAGVETKGQGSGPGHR